MTATGSGVKHFIEEEHKYRWRIIPVEIVGGWRRDLITYRLAI